MKTFIIFFILGVVSLSFADEPKVYTEEDLKKYKREVPGGSIPDRGVTRGYSSTPSLKIEGGFNEEPDGFRGLRWGTDISKLPEMQFVSLDPSFGGVRNYRRKGEVLTIGGAKLRTVEYGFWNGKLGHVTIYTSGYGNYHALKEACFEKYGSGFQSNKYIEKFFWQGPLTTALLQYNTISEEAMLSLTSREIGRQEEEHNKSKAKEGAAGGF